MYVLIKHLIKNLNKQLQILRFEKWQILVYKSKQFKPKSLILIVFYFNYIQKKSLKLLVNIYIFFLYNNFKSFD